MTLVAVAARDASPAEKADADLVCDGRTDLAELARAVAVPDREVVLSAGRYNANGGRAPDGTRCLRPT